MRLHVFTVRKLGVTVSERQLLRLDHKMQSIGALRAGGFQIEVLENFQHFQRHEALRGRWHLVNIVAAVARSDRLDPVGAVLGEISKREYSAEPF